MRGIISKTLFRKTLSAPGLLRLVCGCFGQVDDPVSGRGLSLSDCLRSALAMFGLKYPPLLSFERDAHGVEQTRSNGATKNDCERNAAKQLLVVEDGLASNGPHIRLLNELVMRYVLGAKPEDHVELFRWVGAVPATRVFEVAGEDGARWRFRYLQRGAAERFELQT